MHQLHTLRGDERRRIPCYMAFRAMARFLLNFG
jgi:hypothetical protein